MTTSPTVSTVDGLTALVGQELGVSDWTDVTQERIDTFADVTGDHQWIHVDVARAQASPLGGTIAHGYFTLSLLPGLREHGWQGVTIDLKPKMVFNYGLNRVRFISPVKVGSRVRLRSKLLAVDEVQPGVYQLTSQQTVEIEGQEKPALVAETLARLYV